MSVRLLHATANRPGAIAILQIEGDCLPVLRALTGVQAWPLQRMRLVKFGDIDEGLAVRLTETVAQFMPHGGPRVLQRLTAQLLDLGATIADPTDPAVDPMQVYPEAADHVEALMMMALARAHSLLAIDLLLDQPRRWRAFTKAGAALSAEDQARSRRLNRLIDPPIVVLAGRPNVGKSTLSNALLGRSMSIAFDAPGTTRDYTAGRIDLAGLVVDWHDTPGIRPTDDPIERKAVELARRLIGRADLLIALADPQTDWPDLPRDPDLRVMNKIDLLRDGTQGLTSAATPGLTSEARKTRIAADIHLSARTGDGIPTLVAAARDRLVQPDDLAHPGPWLFDARLAADMP